MNITPEKRNELIDYIRVWYPDWQDFRHPRFQSEEIEYKRTAAEKAQELLAEPVLRELLEKQDYEEIRQRLKKVGQLANLLYVATPSTGDLRLLSHEGLDLAAFARQVTDLLYGPDASEDRLQRFLDYCVSAGLSEYWTFPTYYLYLCHPENDIFVKPDATHTFCRLIDPEFPWSSKPTRSAYAAIKETARAVIQSFSGLGARDMIDAHSVIWTCGSVVKERLITQAKCNEFSTFFSEFLAEYAASPAGREYAAKPERVRATAQANYQDIVRRRQAGEDVTDLVLLRLLPYVENERSRASGVWLHYAATINGDVRLWYEGSKWAKPEEWPSIADHILSFISRCIDHPEQLDDVCQEFGRSRFAKGFQTGTLTPILNALDPVHFALVNNKTRAVLNYLAGKNFQQSIVDYAATNRAYYSVVAELQPTLEQGRNIGLGNADLFDMFCHWLVTIKDFSFASTNYWKIAPGEGAWQWPECQEGGFIAIGWDKLGDLSGISKSEFLRQVEKFAHEDAEYNKHACEQVWKFAKQIKEGDRIVANQGTKKVLGIGRVTGTYYFVPDVKYGHRLPVEWYDAEPRRVDEAGWHRTLVALDAARFDAIVREAVLIGTPPTEPPSMTPFVENNGEAAPSPAIDMLSTGPEPYSIAQVAEESGFPELELERWVRAIERKKQAVLYGPPGTGKTFMAELLAKHLIGGGDGFSEVVQFHPAFAYEDFVQGIRPQPNTAGGLEYPVMAGRFVDFSASTVQDREMRADHR